MYYMHTQMCIYIYVFFSLSRCKSTNQPTNNERITQWPGCTAPQERAPQRRFARRWDQWRPGMWLGQGGAMFWRDFIGGFMMFNGDLIGVGGSCDLVAV